MMGTLVEEFLREQRRQREVVRGRWARREAEARRVRLVNRCLPVQPVRPAAAWTDRLPGWGGVILLGLAVGLLVGAVLR